MDDSSQTVCIVATQQETFDRCRDGIYPAPASYDRVDRPFEYLAFYRTAPVSAVTHFGRVTDRIVQDREEPGPMRSEDWETMIDPFSTAETAVVFELAELQGLETPIENDLSGVRGAWYCSLDELQSAATLSELKTDS